MSKIKVIVRKDLEMKNGKLIAQVSHSLTKLISSLLVENNDGDLEMSLSNSKKISQWRMSGFDFDLEMLNDADYEQEKEGVNKDSIATVFDNGLTCFNNEITETCSILFNGQFTAEQNHIEANSTSKTTEQRQSIAISTRPRRDSLSMLRDGVFCSADSVVTSMVNHEGRYKIRKDEEEDLYTWITGSYAKIVLGASKKEKLLKSIVISELEGVKTSRIKEKSRFLCVSFSPVKNNIHKKLTSEFRPLN